MKIKQEQAWDHIKSINDFEEGSVPPFSYNFDDNYVKVKPIFVEAIQILWRPEPKWDGSDAKGLDKEFKEDIENTLTILNKKFKKLKIAKNYDFMI